MEKCLTRPIRGIGVRVRTSMSGAIAFSSRRLSGRRVSYCLMIAGILLPLVGMRDHVRSFAGDQSMQSFDIERPNRDVQLSREFIEAHAVKHQGLVRFDNV